MKPPWIVGEPGTLLHCKMDVSPIFLERYINIPTTEAYYQVSSKRGPSASVPKGIVYDGVIFLLLSNISTVFRTFLVKPPWVSVNLPD